MTPCLYIFSGLPGVGKSTIAKELSRKLKAVFIRIDTIEHGITDLCDFNVEGEGYRLSYRIALDNLLTGNDVIFDCVNPCELTRGEIENVAKSISAKYVNIEVICSNKEEHRNRVENRKNEIEGFNLPTWDDVEKRDYQKWKRKVIRVDTYNKDIEECLAELIEQINNHA
jgi:predicted kinase